MSTYSQTLYKVNKNKKWQWWNKLRSIPGTIDSNAISMGINHVFEDGCLNGDDSNTLRFDDLYFKRRMSTYQQAEIPIHAVWNPPSCISDFWLWQTVMYSLQIVASSTTVSACSITSSTTWVWAVYYPVYKLRSYDECSWLRDAILDSPVSSGTAWDSTNGKYFIPKTCD